MSSNFDLSETLVKSRHILSALVRYLILATLFGTALHSADFTILGTTQG
jgi:hypothetical protein